MGRGRTTTGMVIATIMDLCHKNPSIVAAATREQEPNHQSRYENGEYAIILSLLAVLDFGKVAKSITDAAIDACNHMQNLRTCINDYRVHLLSIEKGTEKYKKTFELGCNYLIRYFYLIVFTDYLLQQTSTSFSEWLRERREIQTILRQSLD